MVHTSRYAALEVLERNDYELLKSISALVGGTPDQRELLHTHIITLVGLFRPKPTNPLAGAAPQLKRLLQTAERFRATLDEGVLKDQEAIFDRPMSEYAAMVDEFVPVAAYLVDRAAQLGKRTRGGQPRRDLEEFEQFAEGLCRAARQCGYKLTVNRNATSSSNLPRGTFAEVLTLLRPCLPGIIPRALTMRMLDRLKSKVDSEANRAA